MADWIAAGRTPFGYMEYMAERPRSHGLFGDEDCVDMNAVGQSVLEHPQPPVDGGLDRCGENTVHLSGQESQIQKKLQIEVTQGPYPPVPKLWDDVFGPKRRDYDE